MATSLISYYVNFANIRMKKVLIKRKKEDFSLFFYSELREQVEDKCVFTS